MKTKYLSLTLTALFFRFSISPSAQTIKVGQHKVGHHTFLVSKTVKDGHVQLLVRDNPDLISRIQNTPNSSSGIEFPVVSGRETIKSSFIKVLGMERIKELVPERHALVELYFDTNGKVKAVVYFLNNNSKLTLKEINALTTFMKQNITFKIPTFIEKNGKCIISWFVATLFHLKVATRT